MKIGIAQINPTIGDLKKNVDKMVEFSSKAKAKGADLVIFPELSLVGYPPKDLLLRNDFLDAQIIWLDRLANELLLPAIVGCAVKEDKTKAPFNAAVLCNDQQWNIVAKKILLPNYNVFDEKRYFEAAKDQACNVFSFLGKNILISICEDAWSKFPYDLGKTYDVHPIDEGMRKHKNVDVILNISASPYSQSKPRIREEIFTAIAKKHQRPVVVCGQVGGNDQLLFDGHSMVLHQNGDVVARAPLCDEDVLIYDVDAEPHATIKPLPDDDEVLLKVLTMGVRDYVEKCRMPGLIIGVSGGIDSAICLVLAVRALGKDRVRAIFLPTRFTSQQSLTDSQALVANLGIELEILPLEDTVENIRSLLKEHKRDLSSACADILDQNIQARLRGMIIMALSNSGDYLMMTTSNKSELAVGYSTMYGDMCGAFSAIGDLYKTEVWRLAKTINRESEIIPTSIIERKPTAELKENQFDSDSLPDYPILDAILINFIEQEKSAEEIAAITQLPRALIDKVIKMVDRSEYKRRQAPFAFMVSDKVFGDARRVPIAKRVTGL